MATRHRADLHHLGPDGDLALAEVIGEPPSRHAEEHERHGEEKRDHGDEGVAFVFAEAHADDHGQKQIAQDVVAECALKLGGDQRPEAALTAWEPQMRWVPGEPQDLLLTCL